jgi:hypothetical protein
MANRSFCFLERIYDVICDTHGVLATHKRTSVGEEIHLKMGLNNARRTAFFVACFVIVCVVDAKKNKKDVIPPEHTYLSDALAALAKVQTPWMLIPAIVGALLATFAGAYAMFGGAKLIPPPPAPTHVPSMPFASAKSAPATAAPAPAPTLRAAPKPAPKPAPAAKAPPKPKDDEPAPMITADPNIFPFMSAIFKDEDSPKKTK